MNLLSKSDSALKPIPSKILTWFYNSIFSVLVRSIFRLFGKTRPALKNQLQSKYKRLKLYPDPFAPVEDHGCWFLCASWRSVSHDKRCPHGWSCQWKRGQPQCGLVKQCGAFRFSMITRPWHPLLRHIGFGCWKTWRLTIFFRSVCIQALSIFLKIQYNSTNGKLVAGVGGLDSRDFLISKKRLLLRCSHRVPNYQSKPPIQTFVEDVMVQLFQDLSDATLNWSKSRQLGSGSYGAVFKGEMKVQSIHWIDWHWDVWWSLCQNVFPWCNGKGLQMVTVGMLFELEDMFRKVGAKKQWTSRDFQILMAFFKAGPTISERLISPFHHGFFEVHGVGRMELKLPSKWSTLEHWKALDSHWAKFQPLFLV